MKTAKIITISGCAVGAVLFIGAGFMLYRGIVGFSKSRSSLEQLKGRLESYYKAPVFPSSKNIKIVHDNTEQADEWFKQLIKTLAEGNIVQVQRSPTIFITAGNKVRRNLAKKARKSGTTLPDQGTFAFGFERYAGNDGVMPDPDDVPRLLEQLIIIGNISTILFEKGIKELSAVKREVFESTGGNTAAVAAVEHKPKRGSARGRHKTRRDRNTRSHGNAASDLSHVGIIGKDDLYAKMHFTFDFRAKEKTLFDILNAFSANKMFIVVTSVTISKKTPELVPPKVVVENKDGAKAAVGDSLLDFGDTPSKEEKTQVQPRLGPNYPVCGIKQEIPMEIHLELDVYKFKEVGSDSGH